MRGLVTALSRRMRAGALFASWVVAVFGMVGALGDPAHAQGAVCAEVKIEIKQTVSFERQAFDATLRVRNGLDTFAVEQVVVDVRITDDSGNVPIGPSGVFSIVSDGTSGSWNVPPSSVGERRWLIVPGANAGGTTASGKQYSVGATINYVINGEARTVDVTPVTITVLPQPQLTLDYFLPRHVYGADPLTGSGEEEPIPFTLGVRVRNTGYGHARNVKIESAQPVITENNQGLLVVFDILESFVDSQPAQPTLTIDFGDVTAGTARTGRWMMTSSLSGTFEDFEARYTHAGQYGGAIPPLLLPPVTHTLIKDVELEAFDADGVRDFLARDVDVARLYSSSGLNHELDELSGTLTATATTGQFALSVDAFPTGIGFVKVDLPATVAPPEGNETLAFSVVRVSDGMRLHAANAWHSKERNANLDWEHFINVFDSRLGGSSQAESYVVTFGDAPNPANASIRGAVYEDSNANGVQDVGEPAMAGVDVRLIGPAGVADRIVTTDAAGSFRFPQLAAGSYSLEVSDVAGLVNGVHAPGSHGGTVVANGIASISLPVSAQATGYFLAKSQTPVLPTEADLRVKSITASSSSPMPYDEVLISMVVKNDGPATTSAVLQLDLPEGIDASNKLEWTLAAMSAGEERQFSARVYPMESGTFSISATVTGTDVSIVDPNVANNTGSVTLEVEEAEIKVSLSHDRRSRVLVFATCRGTALPGCDSTRGLVLSNALGDIAVDNKVVSNVEDFRLEMRSGRWNTYWISGGAADLGEPDLYFELGLARLRGETIIVDGADGSASDLQAIGAPDVALPDVPHAILVPSSPSHPAASFTVDHATCYTPQGTGTSVSGEIGVTGCPAILAAEGTLLFGFDVVEALSAASGEMGPLLEALLSSTQPSTPAVLLGGSFHTVAVKGTNPFADPMNISMGSATLGLALPPGSSWVSSEPSAFDPSAASPSWWYDLESTRVFDASAGVWLPDGAGTLVFEGALVDASHMIVASSMLSLETRSFTQLAALTRAAIVGEVLDDPSLGAQAVIDFDAAVAFQSVGRWDDALAAALRVATILEDDSGAPGVREHLGWFLYAIQRGWQQSLPVCSATGVTQHVVESTSFIPLEWPILAQGHISSYGATWLLTRSSNFFTASESMPWVWNLVDQVEWAVTFTPRGGMTLSVKYPDDLSPVSIELDATYDDVYAANAARLQVDALGTATSMQVWLDTINGAPAARQIVADGTTEASATSSIALYGPEVSNRIFTIAGRIQPQQFGLLSELAFTVDFGTMSCRP